VRRDVAALAGLVLVAACGPGRVIRQGDVNTNLLAQIERQLAVVRGLRFTADVPARALGPQALGESLAHELDLTYKPGDLERIGAVYTRLGLLAPGIALRTVMTELYEGQVAAFYDPRTKSLAVATEATRTPGFWVGALTALSGHDFVGELLVSHELTHALQDQHWGLPVDPEPLTASHSDRLLARRALLEGDATLASFAYVRGGGRLDPGTINWIESELHAVPAQLAAEYPDVPEVVRATLAFQYDAGATFTGWALGAGGWAEVDRVHADPPESTEQVLHPARYFGHRDRPVTIEIGGTESLTTDGWTRTFEDTLGELDIRALAGRFLPAERATIVADGWGGDRLCAFERGGALVLVWMTAWDSPGDAAEFADAMGTIAPGARVEHREDRVLVLVDAPAAERLAARVWARTTLARASDAVALSADAPAPPGSP
jgi:hypothetical protein